jgi:hypothetical protein
MKDELPELLDKAADLVGRLADHAVAHDLRSEAKLLREAWGVFLKKSQGAEPLPFLEDLAERAGAAGYHLQYQSPFQPGDDHHVGLTPHGCSGWNGRADHRFSGTLAAAIETAAAFLCLLEARAAESPDVPPEIRIQDEDGWTVRCENYFLGAAGSWHHEENAFANRWSSREEAVAAFLATPGALPELSPEDEA